MAVSALLATSACGFKRKKYENPITKDTQQPDKILFDKSIKDIEKGRYELARLTLNTLINTYDTSEFLAKAKLAIADVPRGAGPARVKNHLGWLMSRRRPFDCDIEFDETIEQRCLPVETRFT